MRVLWHDVVKPRRMTLTGTRSFSPTTGAARNDRRREPQSTVRFADTSKAAARIRSSPGPLATLITRTAGGVSPNHPAAAPEEAARRTVRHRCLSADVGERPLRSDVPSAGREPIPPTADRRRPRRQRLPDHANPPLSDGTFTFRCHSSAAGPFPSPSRGRHGPIGATSAAARSPAGTAMSPSALAIDSRRLTG